MEGGGDEDLGILDVLLEVRVGALLAVGDLYGECVWEEVISMGRVITKWNYPKHPGWTDGWMSCAHQHCRHELEPTPVIGPRGRVWG